MNAPNWPIYLDQNSLFIAELSCERLFNVPMKHAHSWVTISQSYGLSEEISPTAQDIRGANPNEL